MRRTARVTGGIVLSLVLFVSAAIRGWTGDAPPEEDRGGVMVELVRLDLDQRVGVPLEDVEDGTAWIVPAHVRVRNASSHRAFVTLQTTVAEERVWIGAGEGRDATIHVVVDRWGSRTAGIGEVRVHALQGRAGERGGAHVAVPVHGLDALTVGLLVERKTFEFGEARFGSFARRMRECLEDLHALFDDPTASTPRARLGRAPIRDRFRIEWIEVYDRRPGERPAAFDATGPDARGVDLVIACDEGGPLGGFRLPQYAIGHNFRFPRDGRDEGQRGLWSSWGQRALWHELLHFRGVPDTYVFHVPKQALPGRASADVPLPDAYRLGLMNSPYQEPRLSALTAALANANRGVKRVGACEDPARHEHGHMWRWVPERLRLRWAKGGEALVGAKVRWWASGPVPGLPDPRMQGVPEGQAPDGQAVADGKGEVVLVAGEVLNRERPRRERSLWLLVEVEVGGDRRFDVVRLLELNEAWAAGDRTETTRRLPWSSLHPTRAP